MQKLKQEIDGLTYPQLLCKWRFAAMGDALFNGESGDYIAARLQAFRDAPGVDEVATSKAVGWKCDVKPC